MVALFDGNKTCSPAWFFLLMSKQVLIDAIEKFQRSVASGKYPQILVQQNTFKSHLRQQHNFSFLTDELFADGIFLHLIMFDVIYYKNSPSLIDCWYFLFWHFKEWNVNELWFFLNYNRPCKFNNKVHV